MIGNGGKEDICGVEGLRDSDIFRTTLSPSVGGLGRLSSSGGVDEVEVPVSFRSDSKLGRASSLGFVGGAARRGIGDRWKGSGEVDDDFGIVEAVRGSLGLRPTSTEAD